jgi:hypothetical protein
MKPRRKGNQRQNRRKGNNPGISFDQVEIHTLLKRV